MTKKIFISIPWFTPAFRAGGPIQSIFNLVSVEQDNYEYYIFCGNRDLNNESLDDVVADKWQTFNNHTQVFYASSRPFTLMKREFLAIQPDCLFVIGMFSVDYNIKPLLLLPVSHKILSVRGMLHPGALSQKSFKKRIFLSLMRSLGIQQKTIFHATDMHESAYVSAIFGKHAIVKVAGNYPAQIQLQRTHQKQKGSIHLITVALISPMKNHLLVLQSLMKCRAEIRYEIIGSIKDKQYWNLCEQLIRNLPSNVELIMHGEQPPSSLPQFYSNADIMIMPSKSENFAHSIIEALSGGIPVITSHFTPWNQLEENQAGMNVALNEDDIAAAIDLMADMSADEFEAWRSGAKEYVAKTIHKQALRHQYQQLFG